MIKKIQYLEKKETLKDKILKRIKGAYGIRTGATAIGLAGFFLFSEHGYNWGYGDTFGHDHIGIILLFFAGFLYWLSNKVGIPKNIKYGDKKPLL